MNATTAAAVLGTGALALALGGCSKTLNTDNAEKLILKGIAKQTGAKMKSVDCPSDVTAKKGGTFTCTAKTADGQTGKVEVTQRDDSGHITWEITSVG